MSEILEANSYVFILLLENHVIILNISAKTVHGC